MSPTYERLRADIVTAMKARDYAFVYSCFPILMAYQKKWNEGSPHDLLIEYINAEPFLELVREVTGGTGYARQSSLRLHFGFQ